MTTVRTRDKLATEVAAVSDLSRKAIEEIAGLGDIPRSALADRWQAIYGVVPPKGARRVLLERAIAWHVQAKVYGGLKKDVTRSLVKAAAEKGGKRKRSWSASGDEASSSSDMPPPSRVGAPSPGARLVREWHGRTHVVDVTKDGYVWNGTAYRSLSVIARRITGAHWSGPRFFGL